MKRNEGSNQGHCFKLGIKSIEEEIFWNHLFILLTNCTFFFKGGININILHIITYTGYFILQHKQDFTFFL